MNIFEISNGMIDLDANASTPIDPEVWSAMEAVAELHGNPSSVHGEGQRARRVVEEARGEIAALVGGSGAEVLLTSGGTEANALALFGVAAGRRGRIVITAAEHPSVREAAHRLASDGRAEVVEVPPEGSGALDPARLLAEVVPGTILVSVMAANNEYGGLFPVAGLALEVRRRGALFHTDAVQAAGRIPVDVQAWDVDLLTLSAHKIHGPKGAGALWVRRGVGLSAHTPGGGQEKRLRAGTENTLAIAGFGRAARLAARRRETDAPRIALLRDRLEQGVLEGVAGTRVLGGAAPRLPNTSAVVFEGASGESLLMRLDLDGIAVSTGSACSSGTLAPSPAVLSLGLSESEARSVIRFSLSRATTPEEIDRVLDALPRAVEDVRAAGAVEAAAGPASGRHPGGRA